MKDKKKFAYKTIFVLYLIVAFFLETNLRITVNVSFCVISVISYYSFRKKTLNIQDSYFINFLTFASIGCLVQLWRYLQAGVIIEMLISIIMLFFFLLSLKSRNQYLFLGTKWVLILGIVLTLSSILYFTNHFLPYINDLNAPLSGVFVFFLGFIFIITLVRTVNDSSYLLPFLGICFIIASRIVAAFSIYHNLFNLNNFLEDALSISGVYFLTVGMLQITTQTDGFQPSTPSLSLLYFLKKIL